jgi:alpha-L-rhamnosidase
VKHADLFVTGEDSAAAWVNGKQVLETVPLPPWKQAPWKTYLSHDVTSDLRAGENMLAVGVTLYGTPAANGIGAPDTEHTPMTACLYIEMEDGSSRVLASGTDWKAVLNAEPGWQEPKYDDSDWQNAVAYEPPKTPMSSASVGNPWQTGPVKLLRHGFAVDKPVTSARLYVTALGAYRMQINGVRVGDQVLSPGWDDFRTHVPYQAYDVTQQLKTGQNVIGAWLAPGWYTTPLMWFRQGYNYGDTPPALKAQLRIEHADGSVDWISTDASWKADLSPISSAEIYDGESYDARKEQSGWDTPGFSDARWKQVDMVQPSEPEIIPQSFPPIRAHETLTATAITSPKPGVYIYDFHQNLAGVARLRARGAAGDDIQLRFAEVLNPDGTLYIDNLRTAKATDHFVLSGKDEQEFQPDFTFHGFRYVEVRGLKYKPDLNTVKAVAFYTDAPGLDRGCAGLLANCIVQHGPDAVLEEVCPGYSRHPGGHTDVWYFRSRHRHSQSRFWRRLERCGRHYSLDRMDPIRRHPGDRAELGCDAEVPRHHPAGQSNLFMEERVRDTVRRLALARRPHPRASGRNGLLGLRRNPHAADGARPGQDRRGNKVR